MEGFDRLKIKVNGYLQPPFPVDHLYKVRLHYSIYVTLTNTLLYLIYTINRVLSDNLNSVSLLQE